MYAVEVLNFISSFGRLGSFFANDIPFSTAEFAIPFSLCSSGAAFDWAFWAALTETQFVFVHGLFPLLLPSPTLRRVGSYSISHVGEDEERTRLRRCCARRCARRSGPPPPPRGWRRRPRARAGPPPRRPAPRPDPWDGVRRMSCNVMSCNVMLCYVMYNPYTPDVQ